MLTRISFQENDDLAIILKDHFAPKKLLSAERYRFHNCIQLEGEGVSTFAAKLKHLASTCNFATHLSEALRDRLVCGLRNKDIQKKLLTAEHNLDEALKKALGAEAAEEGVAAFSQKDAGHATPVNKLDSDGRPPYRPRRPCRPSFSLSVFSINAENKGMETPVELNGIHLLMELDTGAGVSIISQETTGISWRLHSNPAIPACALTQGTQFKSLVSS